MHFVRDAPTKELGLWDDVFVADEQDNLILRRAGSLFVLPATETDTAPRKLVNLPELNNSQIRAGLSAGQSLWLLIEPDAALPFALEIYSGKIARFPIPKLKVPGDQSPQIQSWMISPQNTAIIAVSNGDNATWPRDEGRPLYFWLDLKSGRVVAFPIGWDLSFLSADQGTVSFSGAKIDANWRRPGYAVDMATAKTVGKMPERKELIFIPYDWSNTSKVQLLAKYREGEGERDYFAGVSTGKNFYPMDFELEGDYFLGKAAADGSHAAFWLKRRGTWDENNLYLSDLNERNPQLITTKNSEFELFGRGNLVYAEVGHGHLEQSSATYFLDSTRQKRWDVLDGSDRLPELTPEFANKNSVEDKLSVRLVKSFGASKNNPLVLCQFNHVRRDMNSAFSLAQIKEPNLKSDKWLRSIVVNSEGERYMTSLFRDSQKQPDQTWLHTSGALFAGTNIWNANGQRKQKQIQLSVTQLSLD